MDWDLNGVGGFEITNARTATTTFETAGARTVRMRLTRNGETTIVTKTVTVNAPPAVTFGFDPDSPLEGQEVDFQSQVSDPEGNSVTRSWNFGDGTTGTGAGPNHAYAAAGTYTVTVTATDSNGAEGSASQTIVVQPDPGPTSSFDFGPTVPDVGETAVFTSTAHASQGSIVDVDWDFDGDGEFDDFSGPDAEWVFDAPGTHNVRMRAEQTNGKVAEAQTSLRVNGVPSADFTWTPVNPAPGDSVDLVSTSSDFEGALAELSWDLDGDGLFGDGSEAQIRQPFPKTGTFDIGLQVTDSDGTVTTVRKEVVVATPPPPPPPAPRRPRRPAKRAERRHRAERRVEPAAADPHTAPAAHEPVPGHPHRRHGAAPRSADRRALRAGSARLADTGDLRGQRLPGQLGGHHERHAAGPIPQVRAQAAGGHPPQVVRAAGEPDRQVHELPDPRGRAAEARGPVPVPAPPLSRTLPMTRTWTAALAVIAFAAAFLAASVALGGEAEPDGSRDRPRPAQLRGDPADPGEGSRRRAGPGSPGGTPRAPPGSSAGGCEARRGKRVGDGGTGISACRDAHTHVRTGCTAHAAPGGGAHASSDASTEPAPETFDDEG